MWVVGVVPDPPFNRMLDPPAVVLELLGSNDETESE